MQTDCVLMCRKLGGHRFCHWQVTLTASMGYIAKAVSNVVASNNPPNGRTRVVVLLSCSDAVSVVMTVAWSIHARIQDHAAAWPFISASSSRCGVHSQMKWGSTLRSPRTPTGEAGSIVCSAQKQRKMKRSAALVVACFGEWKGASFRENAEIPLLRFTPSRSQTV